MGKIKKKVCDLDENQNLDDRVLLLCCISVFIISFIARFKEFYNIPAYQKDSLIRNSTNLFTYYKLVLMALLVAVVLGIYIYKKFKCAIKLKMDYVIYFCGMIILSAFISLLFNPVGRMQMIGFFTRTNGFIAYLVLFLFVILVSRFQCSEKGLKLIVAIIGAFTIVVTLIGLLQFIGHDIYNSHFIRSLMLPSWIDTSTIEDNKVATAAFSIFTHYNYYSGFCSMFFPLLTALAVSEVSVKRRILFSISAVLLFLGVITSISQSGIFTVLVLLFIMLFILANKKTGKGLTIIYAISILTAIVVAVKSNVQTYRELGPVIEKILSKPIFALLALLALGLTAFGLYIRKYFEKNKKLILKSLVVVGTIVLMCVMFYLVSNVAATHKHMLTDRGYAWTHTYELLVKNPVIGYGPDNFYYAFPQDSPEAKSYADGLAYDKPHNMFLQMYMDTGILGLLGFIGLLLFYMLSLVKSDQFYEHSRTGAFLKGSFLLIVAYIIQGMVNDNQMTVQPMLFFVMALGMGITKQVYNKDGK